MYKQIILSFNQMNRIPAQINILFNKIKSITNKSTLFPKTGFSIIHINTNHISCNWNTFNTLTTSLIIINDILLYIFQISNLNKKPQFLTFLTITQHTLIMIIPNSTKISNESLIIKLIHSTNPITDPVLNKSNSLTIMNILFQNIRMRFIKINSSLNLTCFHSMNRMKTIILISMLNNNINKKMFNSNITYQKIRSSTTIIITFQIWIFLQFF